MSTHDMFDNMLKNFITPSLMNLDFKKSRFSYYQLTANNWRILNFQKSISNNNNLVKFTINVGVASGRLLAFMGEEEKRKKPDIWDCHWLERIGYLMPEHQDLWWTISDDTDIEQLGHVLLEIINMYGVPELEKYSRDSALRDLWLSGNSPSLTEFKRLIFLAALLKDIGPTEFLGPTINEIKRITINKPTAIAANAYLEKIVSE